MSATNNSELTEFIDIFVSETSFTKLLTKVYTLSRCGYTQDEISAELNLSVESISKHKQTIRKQIDREIAHKLSQRFYQISSQISIPLLKKDQLSYKNRIQTDTQDFIIQKPLVDCVQSELTNIDLSGRDIATYYGNLSLSHELVHNQQNIVHIPFEDYTQLYPAFRSGFTFPLGFNEGLVTTNIWRVFGEQIHNTQTEFLQEFLELPADERIFGNAQFFDQLSPGLKTSLLLDIYQLDSPFTIGFEETTGDPISIPEYTNCPFTDLDWISITGMIGSGKTVTKNILQSQLINETEDSIIIEFDPARSSFLPTEKVSTATQLVSTSREVQEFTTTLETQLLVNQNSDRDIYVIIDQAHMLLSKAPAVFSRLQQALSENNIELAISVTQEFDDYKGVFDIKNQENTLYVLHKQPLSGAEKQGLGISTDTSEFNLPMESETASPTMLLKYPHKDDCICLVNPCAADRTLE